LDFNALVIVMLSLHVFFLAINIVVHLYLHHDNNHQMHTLQNTELQPSVKIKIKHKKYHDYAEALYKFSTYLLSSR